MDVLAKAKEANRFVSAPDSTKIDMFAKYSIMADSIWSNSDMSLILNNVETFLPLMSDNVIEWAMTEKGKPVFTKAVQMYPRLAQLFASESVAKAAMDRISDAIELEKGTFSDFDEVSNGMELFGIEEATEISDGEAKLNEYVDEIPIDQKELFGDDEESDEGEPEKYDEPAENETEQKHADVAGYNEKVHGGYRRQIENLILSAWEDMYAYHVDGKEIVDGFVVPGGSILSHGESIRYEGILTLSKQTTVKPNTMSNAIFEEFIEACEEYGIHIIKEVSDDANDVKAFKYNPILQKNIASGVINPAAFKNGWKEYSRALAPYLEKKTKELAIKRAETGSDEETYKELSGYIISLMCVNYKDELGTQLRICCGDTSKTAHVARRLVERLKARDKTHRSIAQGKLVMGDAIISESGLSATINIYLNMAGYQAIPQFMGELLCNINEGMYKPSLNKMIIGMDLKNNIVTAPFTKWLLPIIAGSRSGKGVLTLSMLINVIGCGTPLFYLDGKPDMAAMLWKLQERYDIKNAIVVDGIGCKGVTEVDRKPFVAPYFPNMQKMMQSNTSDEILEANYGVLFYLKTMLVILLSTRYYKDQMGSCYGDIFVVFDEMFKVMKTQLETFLMNIDTAVSKTTRDDKERKDELIKMKSWITELLQTYIGCDIGVFGAGIKAVALSQFAQDGQYAIPGYTVGKVFCTNFLLKRAVKLFGRQEGGSGIYGVTRDKGDEVNFDLYDKYFHFGIGTEQGNTYNNLKTFKPLLVLNENDCKELTHQSQDGAFVSDMLNRISQYSDVEQFRKKYFEQEPLASSIGFEGALAQMGRLLGQDWTKLLNNSLTRAYEIADKALRYYGIIGTDNITCVHDYICSFEVKHLWSYNEIIRAKSKGLPLGETGREQSESTSVFGDFNEEPETNSEDFVDFGDKINEEIPDVKFDPMSNMADTPNSFNTGTGIGDDIGFGGKKQQLSTEEAAVIADIANRKQHGTIDTDVDPKPYEECTNSEESTFKTGGKTGKLIYLFPNKHDNVIRLTDENSIKADMSDSSPVEKFEGRLMKTLGGINYEAQNRWNAVLNSIGKRISSGLVTRVMLVQDEMYVNGRYVAMTNILGGFANIRLEDIVNYRTLFAKFKFITEIAIDQTMLDKLQEESPNGPIGLFEMSQKLMKIDIISPDCTREVLTRNSPYVSEKLQGMIDDADKRKKFRAMCAAKNPRLKEMSPMQQNRVWNSTKTFSGNMGKTIQNQLTAKHPHVFRAAGLGAITIGVLAVGGGISLIGKAAGGLFGLIRGFRQ